MKISRERLMTESRATGFRPEVLEKVIYLLTLLAGFNRHPFLKRRLALKGGTAFNLFLSDVPRLSVDIDLNYMFRMPLWPVSMFDARVGSYLAAGIPVLDVHELAVGKLAALFSRRASRDLFDAHQLLTRIDFNRAKMRLAFVLYGAMNRKDWRTVAIDDVGYDPRELENELIPVVRAELLAKQKTGNWAEVMIAECRDRLDVVLPLSANEIAFLDRILDCGEIKPELLTMDADLIGRIGAHPLLQWKALNVRQHRKEGGGI